MADLKNEPPAMLVQQAREALQLPADKKWTWVMMAAARRVGTTLEDYPHGNSHLLLEAMRVK